MLTLQDCIGKKIGLIDCETGKAKLFTCRGPDGCGRESYYVIFDGTHMHCHYPDGRIETMGHWKLAAKISDTDEDSAIEEHLPGNIGAKIWGFLED